MIESLFRINIPLEATPRLTSYGGGLFYARLTIPNAGYGAYYGEWDSSLMNTTTLRVGSVQAITSYYSQKDTLPECQAEEASFFWDNDNQTIYIHVDDENTVPLSAIVISAQTGYARIGTPQSYYINGVRHQPRIKSIGRIRQKVDPFEVSVMSFQQQKVTLASGDGFLDSFIRNPVPGAEGSFILFDTETLQELEYFTGYVSVDKTTEREYSLSIIDKRNQENRKIPRTRFSLDDYPELSSSYVDQLIPEGYGVRERIPCFPVNGEAATGNVKFKYATDATVLSNVYVEDDDVWTEVTGDVLNSDPETGYFELPRSTATGTSGGILSCACKATLREQNKAPDIIIDMGRRYNLVNYDSSNYNITEWESEGAKLTGTVSLYMDKEKEFFKYVEDLQNGTNLWFLYYVEGTGRRSLRVNDANRPSSGVIGYYEIRSNEKPVERTFTQFASTVAVEYNQDNVLDQYSRVEEDQYESQVIYTYRRPQDRTFKALLIGQTEAQKKALVIAEDQREARPVFEVPIHVKGLSDLAVALYDIKGVETSTPATGYWKFPDEIVPDFESADFIEPDFESADEIVPDFSRDFVETIPGREYWGTIRGQVLGLDFNPEAYLLTLTIRERPESEVA